ncbi:MULTISPECIES: glycosyltransferase family 2 protein [unclassified Methylobacterium]|uniref:glycosyltransferase family 2 protein n=1 Tax=unclassified Methylobacterium TaxID=2615210 RepID=UPI0009EBD171|nr:MULTISPECIES: glycosyltransferase family 2 protein [unclassified Methylobacterium]
MRVLISLVVPVYNEAASVGPFLARAEPALAAACRLVGPGTGAEILFVDDGSSDATPAVLLAARSREDGPRIEIVSLSRNFGKEAALAAGLRHAAGRAVIPIDIDLQDPPEVIPEMVAKWLAGAVIVNGLRCDRTSDSFLKKLTAGSFYRLYNLMADRRISAEIGDFRLLDRKVVDLLNQLPERSRFTKGLFPWLGFVQDEVRFVRETRAVGTSKWRYWRLWNLALDGLAGSTTAPLRIWTYIGLSVAGLAFLYGLALVAMTLVSGNPTPGYPSMMATILFLGGLNLLSLGIMGEYVGRIATEVRGRPLYVVDRVTGAPEAAPEQDDEPWNRRSSHAWPPTRPSIGGSPADAPSSRRSSHG